MHRAPKSKVLSRRTALRAGAGALCALGVPPLALSCGDAAVSPEPEPEPQPELEPQPDSPRVRLPKSVAGISVPDSALAQAAADLVFGAAPEQLFNHCMRTYVFGALLFEKMGRSYDRELVFVGSALHDLGLIDAFMSPDERFELDGADAARKFMREQGAAPERAELVWDAIALHTQGSIAARKAPEIAMLSLGAALDAAGLNLQQLSAADVDAVLAEYPRIGFKAAALDTMIALCQKKPFAQLLHPFAEVGRRHIPDFAVPTIEDLILGSAFSE